MGAITNIQEISLELMPSLVDSLPASSGEMLSWEVHAFKMNLDF